MGLKRNRVYLLGRRTVSDMGVCVHLDIAQSVTSAEWKKVYDETLKLVKAFPLAVYRQVVVRGIER